MKPPGRRSGGTGHLIIKDSEKVNWESAPCQLAKACALALKNLVQHLNTALVFRFSPH